MIYVLLANGFEEIEALAFVDILRRAEIDISTVSIYKERNVVGAHNIEVVADILISDISDSGSAVVLPGGIPGTYNLRDCTEVRNMITKYNDEGKYVAAICAAPSVFGVLGILNGVKATSYPSFEDELIGATVSNDRVVHDKNIITSRGAGTAHDFAFKFVEIFKGKKTADNIRSSMLYDI